MSKKNENLESANVIQGPWKKRKQKKLDEALELQEAMRFSDDLSEECLIQLIHTMHENEIDVSEKSFIRDCGYLMEVVKATIYRDGDLCHPIQSFFA